ncbi:MAG: hypothetical protein AAGM38_08815 [Pseudomonadota bacterium]
MMKKYFRPDPSEAAISAVGGPYHHFLLMNEIEHPAKNWRNVFNEFFGVMHSAGNQRFEHAELSDAILAHFSDQISWINSTNPALGNEPLSGLCWCGPTIINSDGADIARKVFGGWARLLSCGPKEVLLTGPNSCISDERGKCTPGSESFNTIICDRDRTVRNLQLIEQFATIVATSSGERYILHFGV